MKHINIVTTTTDFDAMNHEQNWVRAGVFTDYQVAKDQAITWVESVGEVCARSTQESNKTNRQYSVVSVCGCYAASVQEAELDVKIKI